VTLKTHLGGALATIPVGIRVHPDTTALGTLRFLHLGMTLLFAAALTAGILLSFRAIRRELETARLRQDFIDNVSHELRTPLTSIRMYAEMLDEEKLSEAKVQSYLGWIRRESERLSRLIEDVLDFSRVSRGETRLELGPREVGDLVSAGVKLVMPLAEELGVSVETDVADGLPSVRADRDAAVRILGNLLDNAAQHAGEEKRIGVAARADGDRVRVTVWDRGPGISPEEREHLFTRFYRSPEEVGRSKGMGLGLVLSREIARAGGGDLVLLPDSSRGSRFAWIVPVEGEA
jgi:signal transduction histidine kinase